MPVSKSLRYQVLRRDNHTCRYCGRSAPEVRLTVDHVVPETLGGSDKPENLAAACSDCNSGKSATPPDAAQVAQVQDDAIRWSAAVRAVAADMVAEVDRRNELRDQFEQGWLAWTFGGATAPLPGGWRETVDSFIAAGLPLPVLLECVDIAMGRARVDVDSKFRYMCGIGWKRVSELQQAALERVARPSAKDALRQGNGDEVISLLFGALPWCDAPATWAPFIEAFDADEYENEDGSPRTFDHWSDFEKTFTQMVHQLAEEHCALIGALHLMLYQLQPAAVDRYAQQAKALLSQMEADGSRTFDEAELAEAVIIALQDHPEARPR